MVLLFSYRNITDVMESQAKCHRVINTMQTVQKKKKNPLQNSLTPSAKQAAWRSHEYLKAKAVCKSLDFLATASQSSCRNSVGRKQQSSWLKRGESKGVGLNRTIEASEMVSCAGNVTKKR